MAEKTDSLWALADRASAMTRRSPARRYRWVIDAVPSMVVATAVALAVMLPQSLSTEARLSLFAFGLAATLWTLTKLNAAYVALGGVLLLVLTGAIQQEELYETLESDVIWLMIGAFILGEAVQKSGLADRFTRFAYQGERTVASIFWLVTAALIPLTFFVPSTSGRAAVSLPLFRALARKAGDQQVTRALALLIPAIILVSTISTLVGAGSHLIANDLLDEVADEAIGFAQWLIYGLPFGIAASIVTCFVISRMFLDARRRCMIIKGAPSKRQPLSSSEKRTLTVATAMVLLWLTSNVHGIEIATTSFLGAFVLTLPVAGVISWKAGLQAINWNLVLFVGAALVLGEALIGTGAAKWLVDGIFAASGLTSGGPPFLLLLGLALLTLTSHIYLTSHAARAAALSPPLLYMGVSLQVSPVALMFIATVGMNYCLTFPVSSKALLMYQELDEETWAPADLLKLSAVLLPLHALLMVIFYYAYWRYVGLAL